MHKMLYVTYSTLFEKHDKLQNIVIEPIDFERDPLLKYHTLLKYPEIARNKRLKFVHH